MITALLNGLSITKSALHEYLKVCSPYLGLHTTCRCWHAGLAHSGHASEHTEKKALHYLMCVVFSLPYSLFVKALSAVGLSKDCGNLDLCLAKDHLTHYFYLRSTAHSKVGQCLERTRNSC